MKSSQQVPLPERIRPTSLDDFIGQEHLVGAGQPLRLAIENKRIPSMILWGPPGVGKTTLARIIAQHTDHQFIQLSAVSASKADIRTIVEQHTSESLPMFQADEGDKAPILLFLDEIHRFNKAQQDFLLPYVEDGTLTLIGATTENPSFEVISALLSRMQVYTLNSLESKHIEQIIRRGQAVLGIDIEDEAIHFLANYANGDGRLALNLLDNTSRFYPDQAITTDTLKQTLQSKHLRYDRAGEEHYNTISAFIKSMRASDIDASLYYLARMVNAGEDPRFIARRMVIFASEDIGMALPTALVVANAVFRAVETIGLPECQINLAHGVAYLAAAAKSRQSTDAYFEALEDVERLGNLPIPMEIRNAPTSLMKEMGYGKGYEAYPEDHSYLPDALKKKQYYKDKKKEK
ncbi:replication-associated recombination protein A [Anaerolineales bacterium]